MSLNPGSLWSTVGKKILTGVTGLALFFFVVVHLAGNLLLFSSSPEPFNSYSHELTRLGGSLYFAEGLLLLAFLIHAGAAVAVTLGNRRARPRPYLRWESRGAPSRKTLSSSTMIWSGLVFLVFTVIHLKTFKFGPDLEEGYVTYVDGEPVRDLYRLVVEVFSNEAYVVGYVAAMIFLGFHLHHGFWSAFQSLGAHHPRYSPLLYGAGLVFAILLAAGFLVIPVWIYFQGVGR